MHRMYPDDKFFPELSGWKRLAEWRRYCYTQFIFPHADSAWVAADLAGDRAGRQNAEVLYANLLEEKFEARKVAGRIVACMMRTNYEALGETPMDRLQAIMAALLPAGMKARQTAVINRLDALQKPARAEKAPRRSRSDLSPRERDERRALADGWYYAGPIAAGLEGLATSISKHAHEPSWGYGPRRIVSSNLYSRRYHSQFGPASYLVATAHVEYLDEGTVQVHSHPVRAKDRTVTLTRTSHYRWSSKTHGWKVVQRTRHGVRYTVVRGPWWCVVGRGGIRGGYILAKDTDANALWSAGSDGSVSYDLLHSVRSAEVLRLVGEFVDLDQLTSFMEFVSSDDYGRLYRIGDLSVCRVVCPSTGRVYWLRVPPEVRTAHEAVAWSFGMSVREYVPDIEA